MIFQEQVTGYNMTNSGGVFDVPIGSGAIQYPNGAGTNVLDAFNNSTRFTCGSCTSSGSTYSCTPGSGRYQTTTGDGRKLRVQFFDGVGWKLISPDAVIRSVPFAGYALSAEKLGNNIASDFLIKTGLPTCTAGTFLSWDGSALSCAPVSGTSGGTVTNVTSSNSYISISNSTSTPTITVNVGTTTNTVAAGNDPRLVNAIQTGAVASGDLAGTYPGPNVVGLQGVGVSSTTPTSGQFFKFNGTQWSPSAIATSDVSGLNASLSSYLTQSAFNSYVASANCTSSQTMYWNSVAGNFQCLTINATLSGDVTGTTGAAKVVALQNNPVDITAPALNQVLKWDGSKWAPSTLPAGNPGTVTNVTGTAPINVATGSSTPAISITQATTSTNGYLASVDWNTFNGKQAAGNYVTALTGDVTAVGPGSATATVSALQGNTLTITTPANKDYLKFNGTKFVNAPLATADLSGIIPAANMPAFSGDVTSSAGSTTLTLTNSGITAGTYKSLTVDAKGRVTAGTNPTTLSGMGISDGVQNAGNVISMQAGADASKSAASTNGRFYFATDTQKIYFDNGSSWVQVASNVGSGGTITALTSDVSASGSGSVAATVTSVGGSTAATIHSAELAANAATNLNTASAIIKRDGSGNFAAGSANLSGVILRDAGSNTVTLQAPAAVGTSYILKFPTGVAASNGQVLSSDTSGNLNWITPSTTAAPSGSASGDLSGTYPGPTVAKIQGTAVSAGAPLNGQFFKYNGTNWSGTSINLADIKSTITPFGGAFASAACSANQSLYWQSSSDTFQCQSVAINDGQVTNTVSRTANTFLAAPNGSAGAASYRAIASADLPTTGASGAYINGGNSFGAAATLGTNDGNTLGLKTNGSTRMTIDTSGNVGVGTASPAQKFHLQSAGDVYARIGSSGTSNSAQIEFQRGSTQSWIGPTGSEFDLWSTENGPLVIGVNSGERMRIQANGNVGIGTSSASSPLTVNGVIYSSSGGIKFPDGSVQTSASTTNGAQFDSGWFQSVVNNTFTLPHGLAVTPLYVTVLAKDNSSGKIINVSSQYAYGYGAYGGLTNVTFDNTNIKVVTFSDPNIGSFVNGSGTTAVLTHANASLRVLAWTTGGPSPGYWSQSGTSIYYNGGNLGIGTSTPGQALSVNGVIESTSGGIKFPDGTTQTTASSTALTSWTNAGAATLSATTTAPTKGTNTTDSVRWRRVGDTMEMRWNYVQTAAGVAGSGNYLITIPGGYSVDTAKLPVPSSALDRRAYVGTIGIYYGGQCSGQVYAYNSTQLWAEVICINGSSPGQGPWASTYIHFAYNVTINLDLKIPISGW